MPSLSIKPTLHGQTPRHRLARGFSFVEIMVVLAIVAVLLSALLLTPRARDAMYRHQLDESLSGLHITETIFSDRMPAALDHRRGAALQVVPVGATPIAAPPASTSATPPRRMTTMEYFVWQVSAWEDSRAALNRSACKVVDADPVVKNVDIYEFDIVAGTWVKVGTNVAFRTILDPWGTPIEFRLGFVAENPAPANTQYSQGYVDSYPATPGNQEYPFFLSAGPDKLWGRLINNQPDTQDPSVPGARDNAYSADTSR